jgi:hypothetical protein
MDDLKYVLREFTRLLLNICFSYVKMNVSNGLKTLGKESLTALIQGLQKSYDNYDHTSN